MSHFKDNHLLVQLEQQRLVALRGKSKALTIIPIIAIIFLGGGLLLTKSFMGLIIGLLVTTAIGTLLYNQLATKHFNTFRWNFKRHVISTLLQSWDERLKHEPNRGITEKTFRASGLYKKKSDRYKTEDLIHGTYKKTQIQCAEIHSEYETHHSDSDGSSSSSWHTIFKGIFLIADFNKHFRTEVTVLPDVAERSFGFFGKKLQGLVGNLQYLENPDFEKAFVVRSKDPVETRYILTPDFQERLLHVRKVLGPDIRMSFKNSNFFLTFPNKHNHFEPQLNVPADDQSQINRLKNELGKVIGLIDTLDLNTRIWTKD